jgi:hypothetical protein
MTGVGLATFVLIRVCPRPENGVPFLISTVNILEGNGWNLRTVNGSFYCPPTGGKLEVFAEPE